MTQERKQLEKIVKNSSSIVFFGGAGVSTESGIPDFRSENGIYNATNTYGYSPETMLSLSFFQNNKKIFFEYYRKSLLFPGAKPNLAHLALAKLEQEGKCRAVITQNIDNLHQKAGSKHVLELHGTLYKNYCIDCGKIFSMEYVMAQQAIPLCDACGGVVRPDIVLYEESLKEEILDAAAHYISVADTLIVGGTSLAVYPAAGLIRHFKGERLVLINKSVTPYDSQANLVIKDSIGDVLGEIVGLK